MIFLENYGKNLIFLLSDYIYFWLWIFDKISFYKMYLNFIILLINQVHNNGCSMNHNYFYFVDSDLK